MAVGGLEDMFFSLSSMGDVMDVLHPGWGITFEIATSLLLIGVSL